MPERSLPVVFSYSLLLGGAMVFGVHVLVLYLLKLPLFDNLLIWAYVGNLLLALSIFLLLYFFRNRLRTQIGFLFLGGSMLKFLLFFVAFNPTYKKNGSMEPLEFAAFFVPYLFSLVLETIFTARMLNKMD
ncbi:MAG: hypothetical protein V7724_03670 [Sediminicola sp.]